ncbi:MAG TPA: DUF2269 family protein, partial [Actinomycetota bacterium]|nr:DUF2269 family protein [Actinomycetota bacterium]
AISSTYYDTLKFFHVLAAIVWVGSGVYAQVLATSVIRENDPARMAMVARDIGRQGQHLITPAAISVLVFGVWLVAADPYLNFTTTWIAVGLLGYLLTLITGAGFLGPESARLGKLGAERDPSDPEIQRRIRRILFVSRIDLVVLVVVVADMVFKPGS